MKELIVILLSTFKFAMTFPVAIMGFRLGFIETIIWTNIGGIAGVFGFAFLSEQLISLWNKYMHPLFPKCKRKTRKTFTKRNRRIVHIKNHYGLIGISVITPILLSIPVGAFLVVRYFNAQKGKFLYLICANLIWSFIYTVFYSFFYNSYREFFSAVI